MSNGTSDILLEVIEKSGLISPAALTKAIGEWESLAGDTARQESSDRLDYGRFLEHLVATDQLTTWQAGKIRQGKHKGFLLGNYKLLRHLGTGGMSSVYLAEHVHMRQLRALKVLPHDRVADRSYLARFYREARAAAALDHPNIVHAYDIDCAGDTHFLVVEFIDGTDLQKMVTRNGPLSYRFAVDIIRQVAAGLAHAHRVGVVHRDIKPANLFVDKEGVAKILDMGLARFSAEEQEHQASLTRMHDEHVLGTTNYLSPEQAVDSHTVDGRADIYSLGCTMYFMLTGSPPFPTGTVAQRLMMHLRQKPEPIASRRPGVPKEIEELFELMTRKKPKMRVQSAEEIERWCRQWLKDDSKRAADSADSARSESGFTMRVVSKPGSESYDSNLPAFEVLRTSDALKDTNGGRGEPTGIRRKPIVDDELRIADDEDELRIADDEPAPTRGGDQGSSEKRTKSSAAPQPGSRASSAPVAQADKSGAKPSSKPAGGTIVPVDDFTAELLRAADEARQPPAPAPLSTRTPLSTPARSNSAHSAPRPAAFGSATSRARPAPEPEYEGESVKRDIERLFQLHPFFAWIVFGMFAAMLVLGLYYMVRSSNEPAQPSAHQGTFRDS